MTDGPTRQPDHRPTRGTARSAASSAAGSAVGSAVGSAASRLRGAAESARDVVVIGASVVVGLASLWWDEVRATRHVRDAEDAEDIRSAAARRLDLPLGASTGLSRARSGAAAA